MHKWPHAIFVNTTNLLYLRIMIVSALFSKQIRHSYIVVNKRKKKSYILQQAEVLLVVAGYFDWNYMLELCLERGCTAVAEMH